MIHGAVNTRREAIIPLRVRGPSGAELDLEAVIDTAFSGYLTLPPVVIAALNPVFQGEIATQLGDGTTCQVDVYAVEIEWDGVWLSISVSEIDSAPLVGTRLLAGHEAFIEFNPGGVVEIRRLP